MRGKKMKRYLINCYRKARMVNWQILILTLSITACQPNVQKLESNESSPPPTVKVEGIAFLAKSPVIN